MLSDKLSIFVMNLLNLLIRFLMLTNAFISHTKYPVYQFLSLCLDFSVDIL